MPEGHNNKQEKYKSSNPFELRENELTSADFDDFREMFNQMSQTIMPEHQWMNFSKKGIMKKLFDTDSQLLVIRGPVDDLPENQDRIIATGALMINKKDNEGVGTINNVIVHICARGEGLGRKIMSSLITLAKQRNLKELYLTSGKDRIAAQSLYKSLGFEIVGTKNKRSSTTGKERTTCVFKLDL